MSGPRHPTPIKPHFLKPRLGKEKPSELGRLRRKLTSEALDWTQPVGDKYGQSDAINHEAPAELISRLERHPPELERDKPGEPVQNPAQKMGILGAMREVMSVYDNTEFPGGFGKTLTPDRIRECVREPDGLLETSDVRLAIQYRFSFFEECRMNAGCTSCILLSTRAEELKMSRFRRESGPQRSTQ